MTSSTNVNVPPRIALVYDSTAEVIVLTTGGRPTDTVGNGTATETVGNGTATDTVGNGRPSKEARFSTQAGIGAEW